MYRKRLFLEATYNYTKKHVWQMQQKCKCVLLKNAEVFEMYEVSMLTARLIHFDVHAL